MSSPEGSDDAALQFLATQGWLPLVLADHADFVEAYSSLQQAASAFFALEESSPEKTSHRAASGAQASEEGYSQIPFEKSILTVKTASHCPEPLIDPVRRAWNLTGAFMAQILQLVSTSLELDPNVFAPFVGSCQALPEQARTPTLLRMFRYDRPQGPDPRVNAEKHKDLGLLSLVVGHSPGLSVLDLRSGQWVDVEEDNALPAGARTKSGGLTATLLVGETLAFLTRGKFKAGVHNVICKPPVLNNIEKSGEEYFRYSLVFTLRPAIAPVWTRNFESKITGFFEDNAKAEGESSEILFERIRSAHYNVNIAPDIREQQRKKQMEERTKGEKKARGRG